MDNSSRFLGLLAYNYKLKSERTPADLIENKIWFVDTTKVLSVEDASVYTKGMSKDSPNTAWAGRHRDDKHIIHYPNRVRVMVEYCDYATSCMYPEGKPVFVEGPVEDVAGNIAETREKYEKSR